MADCCKFLVAKVALKPLHQLRKQEMNVDAILRRPAPIDEKRSASLRRDQVRASPDALKLTLESWSEIRPIYGELDA
jgi:hypothetical protein